MGRATINGNTRWSEPAVYLQHSPGDDASTVYYWFWEISSMSRLWQVASASYRILIEYRRNKSSWMVALFEECLTLGGIYIKFLQQLASTEMASEQLSSYKRYLTVFDDAPVESIDVLATLEAQLGVNIKLIDSINTAPFATGSFAQVYGARLISDNSDIIIKIIRPSILGQLKTDCRLLLVLAYIAQPFMRGGLINLPMITREFVKTVRQETDYVHEAMMADYFHEYFSNRSGGIVIPKTYSDISTRSVLIQQRIYGLPLTKVLSSKESNNNSFEYVRQQIGSDLSIQLASIGSELLAAVLQADFIMSDPHPGNLILLPNNKVAMIDFGLASKAPLHRSAFFGMISQYRALYEGRADMGTLAIAMMAFYDYDLYIALNTVLAHGQMTSSLSQYISDKLTTPELMSDKLVTQRQITQLFLQRLNLDNRFAIKIDERDIVLQKAMHNFLSTTRVVCGESYRQSHYWKIVHNALATAEDEAYRVGVTEKSGGQVKMPLEDAQEIVVDWLSAVAERDRVAYQTLTQGGLA